MPAPTLPALPTLPSTEGTQGPREGAGWLQATLLGCRRWLGRQGSGLLVQGSFSLNQSPACIRVFLFLVSPSIDLSRCYIGVGKREEHKQGKRGHLSGGAASSSESLGATEKELGNNTSFFWP